METGLDQWFAREILPHDSVNRMWTQPGEDQAMSGEIYFGDSP